jgi:hypothetical protein
MKTSVVYRALVEMHQGRGISDLNGVYASKIVTFMKRKCFVNTLTVKEYEALSGLTSLRRTTQEKTDRADTLNDRLKSRGHILWSSIRLSGPYNLICLQEIYMSS